MSEWREITIKNAAQTKGLIGGPFGSKLVSRDYVETGVPVIRGQNLGSGRWVDLTDSVFVSESKMERDLASNLAEPGDLIYTQRGTLGQVAIMPSDAPSCVISQSQMRLRVDPSIADPKFVFYWSTSPYFRKAIADHAIVAGVPHINLGILGSLPLLLPPISVQQSVARVLGSIDDLIENNRRRIEVLEEMARSIYREWFVKFRYPGHENVPLVDSELGPIPEGWAVTRLEESATFVSGGTKTKAAYADTGFVAFSAAGPDGFLSDFEIDGPGVVLSAVGARCGKTFWASGKWSSIANTIKIIPKDSSLTAAWLRFTTEDTNIWPKRGSAQPFVSISDARGVKSVRADHETHRRFEEVAMTMIDEAGALRDMMRSLIGLRDTLLPKLVTGQIDVSSLDLDTLIAEQVV
ncbi:restriction endonuclease subunit S [Neomicrococcus aestuarii]|uniref:Type I restriction modification DNA specificity domain-containing protein n=1 Tax=Neomicrococcus aestuarii TaxID=556325 RepID=A0A1L2ZLP4_9MICC|nr:restriction endonuclease subunit S [Neomicrococcus aestuarii]APF39932.1 hypothetical protein BHE16_01630 [Neomicrococcus aestuarii]